MSKKGKCKECGGKGYFEGVVSFGDTPKGYDKPHTEKCDECDVYFSDFLDHEDLLLNEEVTS